MTVLQKCLVFAAFLLIYVWKMFVRNKVILIKGFACVARQITLAEFERINADHVVIICALRRPQFLPEGFDLDLSTIELRVGQLLEHWKNIDQTHLLTAEYANVALDHGGSDVRAVEGHCLDVPWFYETVKALHKSFGQHIIEAQIVVHRDSGIGLKIDGHEQPLYEAVERLKPGHFLG